MNSKSEKLGEAMRWKFLEAWIISDASGASLEGWTKQQLDNLPTDKMIGKPVVLVHGGDDNSKMHGTVLKVWLEKNPANDDAWTMKGQLLVNPSGVFRGRSVGDLIDENYFTHVSIQYRNDISDPGNADLRDIDHVGLTTEEGAIHKDARITISCSDSISDPPPDSSHAEKQKLSVFNKSINGMATSNEAGTTSTTDSLLEAFKVLLNQNPTPPSKMNTDKKEPEKQKSDTASPISDLDQIKDPAVRLGALSREYSELHNQHIKSTSQFEALQATHTKMSEENTELKKLLESSNKKVDASTLAHQKNMIEQHGDLLLSYRISMMGMTEDQAKIDAAKFVKNYATFGEDNEDRDKNDKFERHLKKCESSAELLAKVTQLEKDKEELEKKYAVEGADQISNSVRQTIAEQEARKMAQNKQPQQPAPARRRAPTGPAPMEFSSLISSFGKGTRRSASAIVSCSDPVADPSPQKRQRHGRVQLSAEDRNNINLFESRNLAEAPEQSSNERDDLYKKYGITRKTGRVVG